LPLAGETAGQFVLVDRRLKREQPRLSSQMFPTSGIAEGESEEAVCSQDDGVAMAPS